MILNDYGTHKIKILDHYHTVNINLQNLNTVKVALFEIRVNTAHCITVSFALFKINLRDCVSLYIGPNIPIP
jgi:hypothetical protein